AGRGCQRQQARTRAAPALAALRANTSQFTRIISDFLLPRFQGTFNTLVSVGQILPTACVQGYFNFRIKVKQVRTSRPSGQN
ncbi:hypothetical protein A2U01_0088337, partial [Trifolium medium]|nr:hypothetical protein [Trifolium medium]